MCFLESDAPRVHCPTHGPTVAQVPWARHGAGHTRDFDDTAAWLVTHTPKSAVSELLRIAWRTVGSIIDRVVADGRAAHDPFDGLRRIGIDEKISYKKGHRYLTVVVDHDTGRLVWAGIGRDKKTLEGFFDLLGTERCRRIRLVSADAAEWIADVVHERCHRATLCTHGFHVVQWATEALDEVRREVWNTARRQGRQKAIVALANEILLACHRVLATGEPYLDRGPEQARTRDEEVAKRRALKALHELGYRVTLTPIPQPAG